MALDTISIARLEITKIYIAAFNRAPDAAGLSNWMNQYTAGLMTYKQISEDFSNQAEYKAKYPSAMTNDEYITKIYSNVFGRTPDAGGLENWVSQLDNSSVTGYTRGNIMKAMLEAAGATGNTDGIRLANQAEFAVQAVIVDGVSDDIATAQLANITSDHATVDTATAAVAGAINAGETFNLTAGVNSGAAFTGTTANDTFTANYDIEAAAGTGAHTLGALDVLDGGAGTDTLAITDDNSATFTLATATISNIENMTIRAANAVTADVSGTNITGLNTVSVTQAAGAVLVTAAATTDVNVSGNVHATADSKVVGGKTVTVNQAMDSAGDVITIEKAVNVNVTATDVINAAGINIGQGAGNAVTGTVVVNASGAAASTTTATHAMDAITVTGGTTVNVTQKATSDIGTFATTGTQAAATITQGAVSVTAGAATTDVTVKQDATVAAQAAVAAVAAVAGTKTVTFTKMSSGDTTTVDGLAFTASKDLTAEEVAAAFSNLTASDKQSAGGVVSNGIFTVNSAANYTTGAANGATVTYTETVAGTSNAFTAVNDGVNANPTITAGVTGSTATAVKTGILGVATAAVNIFDTAATATIKTVTVDGYKTGSSIGVDGAGATKMANALTTLNLSNSDAAAGFAVATTATALNLNVNNVNGSLTLDHNGNVTVDGSKTVKTLNITTATAASTIDLQADAVTDLTVAGTQLLTLTAASSSLDALTTVVVTGTAGLNLVDGAETVSDTITSVTTTGTSGNVTVTIDSTKATYTGGAGNDSVTFSNTTAATKAINLGAGNNTLTIATGSSATPTSELISGAGTTDTLVMAAADAEGFAGSTAFEAKITGFERLSLGQVATTADNSVNLANMDDISYVISAGTFDTAEVTVLTTASTGATAATAGTISLVVAGDTFTVAAGETVNAVTVDTHQKALTALAFKIAADARIATAVATTTGTNDTITITSNTGYVVKAGTLTSTLNNLALTATNEVTSSELFLTNMANNGTLELTAAGLGATVTMTDATSTTADVLNVITKVNASDLNFGTVAAAGVETINITATDTTPVNAAGTATISTATLAISDAAAKTINVTGESNLTLISIDTDALTLLDASTNFTGILTASTNGTVAQTIKGGSAADILTATGSNDKIYGGAGNDTLKVTGLASAATLYGEAGTDKFDVSGFKAANAGSAVLLADITSGESIVFATNASSTVAFKSSIVTLIGEATFDNYVTQATADADTLAGTAADGDHGVAWFQFNNNTFIVQDVDGNGAFTDGTDIIVKLNGTVDLSTASFNATHATLEIA